MTDVLGNLQKQMSQAVDALDFEEARRVRDMIRLVEEGASLEEAEHELLLQSMRQRPGAMGLGTGQASVQPPVDWKRPPKPDLLTKGRGRRS